MTHDTPDRDRDESGRFAPGNRVWRSRSSHGRPPVFAGPDDLWNACVEYFEWNEASPLFDHKAFGNGTVAKVPKMRAMTLKALWLHLGIDRTTWSEWRGRPDLSPVTARVDDIIHVQKFEGAAAGLFSPNIIARDLGLGDRHGDDRPDAAVHTITRRIVDAKDNTLSALLTRVGKEGERM